MDPEIAARLPTHGNHVICFGCAKGVGGITSLPVKVCSGCRVATYCSSECQHVDWRKNHPSVCKEAQKRAEVDELRSMVHPTTSATKGEVDIWWNIVMDEACILAMRSAFRLGKPDQLTNTHMLVTQLSWDPRPETIRARFTMETAFVAPFDYLDNISMEDMPTAGNPKFTRLLAEQRKANSAMGLVRLVARNVKTGEVYMPPTGRMQGVSLELFEFVPLTEMRLNPHWAQTLKEVLIKPRQHDQKALAIIDLVRSESRDRIRKVIAADVKPKLDAMGVEFILQSQLSLHSFEPAQRRAAQIDMLQIVRAIPPNVRSALLDLTAEAARKSGW